MITDELIYEVLEVVAEIPEGKVATYGQIAQMIGRKKNARLIGKILSNSESYGEYPCHRVVNVQGRLAPHFHEQKLLLENEGVTFKNNTHVNMAQHRWNEKE